MVQTLIENIQMAEQTTNLEITPSVLDLPPEIIEKIFSYLPAKEVYTNVRNVCHRLRCIADGYVHVGKQGERNTLSNALLNIIHIRIEVWIFSRIF